MRDIYCPQRNDIVSHNLCFRSRVEYGDAYQCQEEVDIAQPVDLTKYGAGMRPTDHHSTNDLLVGHHGTVLTNGLDWTQRDLLGDKVLRR